MNVAKLEFEAGYIVVTTEHGASLRVPISNFLSGSIVLADTDELQTDWANGGRLDLLIDAIKAKTDTI